MAVPSVSLTRSRPASNVYAVGTTNSVSNVPTVIPPTITHPIDYEQFCGGHTPFPSWADVPFLGVIALVITGVLLLFGRIPSAGRARLLFDSAIAVSSVGVLVWYFVLRQLWYHSGLSLFGKLVGVTYPIGDLVTLFCATS